MNILLTGSPGSGKTTLLGEFVAAVNDKQGFLAREIRESGLRAGFELVSATGGRATLASIRSKSPVKVSKYSVNVEEFDEFLDALQAIRPDSLLYIDEIGPMELFSARFKRLTEEYLNQGNTFVGTIKSTHQDKFIKKVLARKDVLVLEVTPDTRSAIHKILEGLAANLYVLEKLPAATQDCFTKMARSYAKAGDYVQLTKLFKNALKYLAESRVRLSGNGHFFVRGNTKEHEVTKDHGGWQCDCDLFLGRGIYAGKPGECSHVQAVKLSASDSS